MFYCASLLFVPYVKVKSVVALETSCRYIMYKRCSLLPRQMCRGTESSSAGTWPNVCLLMLCQLRSIWTSVFGWYDWCTKLANM